MGNLGSTLVASVAPAKCIVCLGNPGAGKSTLLNSLAGTVAFASGLSEDGLGVTSSSQTFLHQQVTYIDTPGLADPVRREQAAAEISRALRKKAKYKILFCITLESGFARPEDLATIELVLEAIQNTSRNLQNSFGVVINKVAEPDLVAMDMQRLSSELFRGRAPATEHITWIADTSDIEDKAGQIMQLQDQFQAFIAGVPWLDLSQRHIDDLNLNKFEQLRQQKEEQIRELRNRNRYLIRRIQQIQCPGPEANKATREVGMKVLAPISYAADDQALQPPGDICAKRNKARELAERGIELGKLLEFYEDLSQNRTEMKHFDPQQSTTNNVVRAAIIPATAKKGKPGISYAQLVSGENGKLATRMVSHNWGNLFSHLVAAVVADALDLPTFEGVLQRLTPKNIGALKAELSQRSKLDLVYWICAFSVNQHCTICKGVWEGDRDRVTNELPKPCSCSTILQPNSSPDCEVDKFDEMMTYMLTQAQLEGKAPRHVVALDQHCSIFSRAWVVAELVVGACIDMSPPLDQKFLTYSKSCLEELAKGTGGAGIDIRDCKASNADDVELVLNKARTLIDSDFQQFNKELNARIFRILEKTRKEIEKSERLHILCMGNAGVGKTTLLRAMTGREFGSEHRSQHGLYEYEHDGMVIMEAPRLVDPQSRRDAAKAITEALKRDGRYALLFVITLESGRVRPQDQEMMGLVLRAAPIEGNYTVIINKVSDEAMKRLSSKDALAKLSHALFSSINDAKGCSIKDIRLIQKHSKVSLPPDLHMTAPSVHVESGLVSKISCETIEDEVKGLQANIVELEEDNLALKLKLEQLRESPQDPEKMFIIGGAQGGEGQDPVQRLDVQAEGAQWGRKDVGLKQSRGLAAEAVLGSDMYIFGGTSNYYRRTALDTVEVFNLKTETWSREAQNIKMPRARYMHRAAACKGKIYIVGGCYQGSTTATTEVAVLDVSTNEWHVGPPLPQPRCRFGIAVDDDCIYVVGGCRTQPANDWSAEVYILDTNQTPLAWTSGPPCPTGREALCAAAWKGKIYTAGGSTRGQEGTAHFEIYDVEKQLWHKGTPMPKKREHVGMAVTESSVYVLGGSGPGTYSGGVGYEVDIYSKETERWTAGSRLKRAVWGPSLAVI